MRLHKRFNAPPGEWAIFCLHLDAGGYGSEFAKLRTPPIRRELCECLAREEQVDLPTIRIRRTQDDWWRHLTFDRESLEAPWARPRPLRPRPDTEQFVAALIALGPSEKQRRLLKAHAAAPRRTASMRALALEALSQSHGMLEFQARSARRRHPSLDERGGGRLVSAGARVRMDHGAKPERRRPTALLFF